MASGNIVILVVGVVVVAMIIIVIAAAVVVVVVVGSKAGPQRLLEGWPSRAFKWLAIKGF